VRIYEKHPEADAYRVGASYAPYALVARANRFTTPELLAQYWFSENMGHHPLESATLYRMAVRPHFDGAS
jgi:hypothetical protein